MASQRHFVLVFVAFELVGLKRGGVQRMVLGWQIETHKNWKNEQVWQGLRAVQEEKDP